MSNNHTQTRALITGGSQGLGRAIAERLIAEGCRAVVISGRDEAKGRAAAEALAASGAKVRFIAADLSLGAEAAGLVDRAAEALGDVTAFVNCAADTSRGSILDTSPELFAAIFATNVTAPYFLLQRFAQLRTEAQAPGAALLILSMQAHGGLPILSPYAASKAAMANVTRNAATALAPRRIRVNALNIGWMDTPGEDVVQRRFHGAADGWLAEAEARQPFGTLIKPPHVAALSSYLLGAEAGVMTGAIIDVDQNVLGAYPDTHPEI